MAVVVVVEEKGCRLWTESEFTGLVTWSVSVGILFYPSNPRVAEVPLVFYSSAQKNMATMAAAIAASLPTVQTTSAPVVPVQATLPASWNKNIDAEAEVSITTVQIDGLVCFGRLVQKNHLLSDGSPQVTAKIIKHSLDSGLNAHGIILGIDLEGILEISNCFPLPNQPSDEDEKSTKSTGWYVYSF